MSERITPDQLEDIRALAEDNTTIHRLTDEIDALRAELAEARLAAAVADGTATLEGWERFDGRWEHPLGAWATSHRHGLADDVFGSSRLVGTHAREPSRRRAEAASRGGGRRC